MRSKIKRNSNFELLRIISIVLIISQHYVQYALYNSNDYIINILKCLCNWATVGVGCFFLISGYFLSNSQTTLNKKNIINILSAVWLYDFTSKTIILFVEHKLSSYEIIKITFQSLISPFNFTYWFITVYLFVYCFSPIFNDLLNGINKKKYVTLLISLFLLIMIQKTWFRNGGNTDLILYGIYTYIVAYYFRNQISPQTEYIIYRYLKYISIIFIAFFIMDNLLNCHYLEWINRIISFPQFIIATTLFLKVKRAKPTYSSLVNNIAKSSLAVYIIHMSLAFRMYGWDLLIINKNQNIVIALLSLICSILIIITCSYALDTIRQNIFNYLYNIKQKNNE